MYIIKFLLSGTPCLFPQPIDSKLIQLVSKNEWESLLGHQLTIKSWTMSDDLAMCFNIYGKKDTQKLFGPRVLVFVGSILYQQISTLK